MADFNINLAKDVVSSYEERVKFYNRMLIYLVGCGAAMVLVGYISAVNIQRYYVNHQALQTQMSIAAAVSGLKIDDFKNPEKIYDALAEQSVQTRTLKKALEQRTQLLPVIHNLFVDISDEVTLQSLSASRDKIVFGLVMPSSTGESGGLVRSLRATWENNDELMKRVSSIRPGTAERRNVGAGQVLFVQFECTLNK